MFNEEVGDDDDQDVHHFKGVVQQIRMSKNLTKVYSIQNSRCTKLLMEK